MTCGGNTSSFLKPNLLIPLAHAEARYVSQTLGRSSAQICVGDLVTPSELLALGSDEPRGIEPQTVGTRRCPMPRD
jgi:hypothetical protein